MMSGTSSNPANGEAPETHPTPWRTAVMEGVGVSATLFLIAWLILSRLDVPISLGTVAGVGAVWIGYRRWWTHNARSAKPNGESLRQGPG